MLTAAPATAGALGIDAGSVRVGLAAADATGTLASPVAVLDASRPDEMWERVVAEATARDSRVLVVGLPLQMSGVEGSAAERARRLAGEARERTGLRVELWDERLSTVEAERALIGQGARRRERRGRIDAVAAAITLQAWLDRARANARALGVEPPGSARRQVRGAGPPDSRGNRR